MPKHLDATDLPEDIARRAEARVAAGRNASIEEVIRAGVEALDERDQAESEWLECARETWHERVAASERGEFTEAAPADILAAIRARVERSL
jgi:Arc/MetJ-type ribon-helix-helix transcriptional regulator